VKSEISRQRTAVHPERQRRPGRAEASVRVMALPWRLHDESLPDGVGQVLFQETPDVIVLTQINSGHLITNRLSPALAAIVPVVDASEHGGDGFNARRADIRIAAANKTAIADTLLMLQQPIARLRSLAPSVLQSNDPRVHLLARLFVRDRGLEPRRDPNSRETVVYADESSISCVQHHAEDLVQLGLLERQFFDKLITCPRCESARISVRERCLACRSSDVFEEPIVHHLRCAHQAPEHEFRRGGELICPKCRAHLEHFSIDYDRPGFVSTCRACGQFSSETSVGLVCLDCAAESDAVEAGSKTIHRYRLTESGRECLRSGAGLADRSQQPTIAVDRIRAFVGRHVETNSACSLLAIKLEAPAGQGVGRAWLQTRALYASMMREVFTAQTEIIEVAPWFFALLDNDKKADVEGALPQIRHAIEQHLAAPPKAHYRVYAPQEVLKIIGHADPTG
jgi:hypothetical protein